MTATFPRETIEFLPAPVTVDGVVTTAGVTYCITAANGVRPVTFTAATVIGGKTGVMVSGYTVGLYRVWSRIPGSPESPVIDHGTFRIT